MNSKLIQIDKEISKNFNDCGYAWNCSGDNFIAYDIFTKNIKSVQQRVYKISKDLEFYCSPELNIYERKIVVNFFF